jgi:ankyrin repeat protein
MTNKNISLPDSVFTLSSHSSNKLRGVRLNKLNQLCLLSIHCVQNNDIAGLTKLIDQGLDITFNEGYLLYVAVECNHKDMVLFLVDKKLDLNTVTYREINLLECAGSRGLFYMCEMLLNMGANPKLEGHDPIEAAARFGFTSVCQILLDFGGFVDMKSPYKNALLGAILGEHHKTLNLLLNNIEDKIDLDKITRDLANKINDLCLLVLLKHGASMKLVKPDDFSKILKSPSFFISTLNPHMPDPFIQRSVELHMTKSECDIIDILSNTKDWLKPYYLNSLANGL